MATRPAVDPVTLAVVRNYLLTTAREMRDTIQRTSFSTVIYEDRDFACGLMDAEGGTMAEAPGLTMFMGTLSPGVRRCLEEIGVGSLNPGDVYCTTMPEYSGSHPSDMMLFEPIFYEGRLFAIAASKAHLIDVGAKDPYPTDSTDAFQEGLRLPPAALFQRGELNELVARLLRANSRAPEVIWGDINAQIAAFRVARQSVTRLLDRYGFDTVVACVREMYDHSERMARAAIARMPKGTWFIEDTMDDNGVDAGKPVPIRLQVTVDPERQEIIFDYSASEPQQRGPTNAPLITTISVSRMMGKILSDPDTPANEGSFRPIRVIAPEGTMFNPTSTAPTMLYGWPAMAAVEGMLKVLAPVFPERLPACSGGDLVGVLRYGVHPETGKMWFEAPLEAMGQGACYDADGENALVHIIEACSTTLSVEVEEAKDPVLVERYELRQDSGGPGKYRGGLGIQRDVRLLAPGAIIPVVERRVSPHWGVEGGKPGAPNLLHLTSSIHGELEIGKAPAMPVAEGDLLSIRSGGGGGWGDPFTRDPEAVRWDVINGYVSLERARLDYGVVIDPETMMVDVEATRRLREAARG